MFALELLDGIEELLLLELLTTELELLLIELELLLTELEEMLDALSAGTVPEKPLLFSVVSARIRVPF